MNTSRFSLREHEAGFGVVELLLIIVVVVVLGGAGWYVWQRERKSTGNGSQTDSNTTPQPQPQPDPYAGWKTYTSTSGKFTLKYPKTWIFNDCSGDALLGATVAEAGHCNSSSVAQIQVSSVAGDERQSAQLKSRAVYPDLSTTTVTVNGIQAIKQTGTTSPGSNSTSAGIPDGTRVTDYIFYLNGRTYVFAYHQEPKAMDISAEANLIVEALTFN